MLFRKSLKGIFSGGRDGSPLLTLGKTSFWALYQPHYTSSLGITFGDAPSSSSQSAAKPQTDSQICPHLSSSSSVNRSIVVTAARQHSSNLPPTHALLDQFCIPMMPLSWSFLPGIHNNSTARGIKSTFL